MNILTANGFKGFESILDQGIKPTLRISFSDETFIDCTYDHELLVDGDFLPACFIESGDVVGSKRVVHICDNDDQRVYDVFNVEDTHSYITNGVTSHNCNLLYCDEFAFVDNDVEFYTSTYPVVSSGKTSRIIVTSTANGIGNTFHKLWEGAVQKTNDYAPFRVDWWDVPGRDEAWKKQTIANTSEEQFNVEFGNTFGGSGTTLISGDKLLQLSAQTPIYTQDGIKVYEKPIPSHDYMIFVDVAKGRGQDYSTFNVIDISTKPFKQVCVYRNNMISPLLFPDIIYKYGMTYNEAYVIIESNDQGTIVCNGLYYDLEYENVFVESAIKAGAIGVNMNKKVKRIGCSNLKDIVESDKIHIVDAQTIIELSTFEARGTSYEAKQGTHDDLVMNLVMFGWFSANPFFSQLTDIDIKSMIHAENVKMIEDDVLPFGIINRPVEDTFGPNDILVDRGDGAWLL